MASVRGPSREKVVSPGKNHLAGVFLFHQGIEQPVPVAQQHRQIEHVGQIYLSGTLGHGRRSNAKLLLLELALGSGASATSGRFNCWYCCPDSHLPMLSPSPRQPTGPFYGAIPVGRHQLLPFLKLLFVGPVGLRRAVLAGRDAGRRPWAEPG